MKKIWKYYHHISNRVRTSVTFSASFIGLSFTILSIVGISLSNWIKSIWLSFMVLARVFVLLVWFKVIVDYLVEKRLCKV